jgi:FtsP/CotA-like multicopper oxidase with cupredoxin domain
MFTNNLDPIAGGMTVHNHGQHATSDNDGQPYGDQYLFDPGTSRTYTYDGTEGGENARGTMHYYHDHRMNETGMKVWMGLAGLYIIDDPDDPATLPSGAYDLPLAIADRQFDEDNQIPYYYDPSGVIGDKVLVNGVYQPYLDVADRKYRIRLLNASNARFYTLTLSTGDAFTQIGTESGLLPAPVSRTAMDIGPAERLDFVVDFTGELGQELYLMDGAKPIPLLKFRVTQHVTDDSTIPTTLRPLPDIGEPILTRNFSFDYTSGHWTINGQGFDPNRVDAQPVLGTTERWIFTNPTGTTHMVHIHDVYQQCLSRDGGACYPYETMKETWSLGSGETLELKMQFTDHVGKYMMHCHILEHEDDGMMGQFEVVAPATPTPTPGPASISGTISYCSNPNPGPVADVTLGLSGDAQGSTVSDSSGYYSFAALIEGNTYTVTPSKSALPPASLGINTLDVVAVQRHFLGIALIPPGCRLTAADVNGDTNINTVDVVAIQRFFLGFSTGLANVGKYQFNPASRTYPTITGDQPDQDYDALIFGDVAPAFADRPQGFSQTTTGNTPANASTAAAVVALPDITVEAKGGFFAPLVASVIDPKSNLVGFQGDITFDSRVITFESDPVRKGALTSGNWNVSGNVLPGTGPMRTLRISAYSEDFRPLAGGGPLLELKMTRVSKGARSTALSWARAPDQFFFIDGDIAVQQPGQAISGNVALTATGKK